jgi:hypothetical protein
MSTVLTRTAKPADAPCRYLTWRAPSGFWMRHVQWNGHMEVLRPDTPLRPPRPRDGSGPVSPPRRGVRH